MVVGNPAHRERSEKLWKLPPKTLNPIVGSHITKMMRDLEDGSLKWLWVQVTNPFQSTANANHWLHAARELDNFIDPESDFPIIATTSKMLTTGIDAQTCHLIVLDTTINSMTEFKQIVGRGTRVHEDTRKFYRSQVLSPRWKSSSRPCLAKRL